MKIEITDGTIANNSAIKTAAIKHDKKLTRKQKAFVQTLVNNPHMSATEAVRQTYNVTTDNSAAQIATENLSKPHLLLELSKYDETAQNTLIEVMGNSREFSKLGNTAGSSYAATAITAANSVLDRLHGKATQRLETTTQAVVLNIDLTGVSSDSTASH